MVKINGETIIHFGSQPESLATKGLGILLMATHTTARVGPERTVFRRWQRYRLNLPIRIIVSRNASTRITNGRAADISQGGVLVFAGIELSAGSEVFVEFTEPYSGEPIRARGLVRHRCMRSRLAGTPG